MESRCRKSSHCGKMLSLSLLPPANFPPPSSLTSSNLLSRSQSPANSNLRALERRLILHLNSGHLLKAVDTLHLIDLQGHYPDLSTYSLLLKSCIRTRNFQLGRLIHDNLTRSQLQLDSIILNSLISFYSKCGDVERAKGIFGRMGNKRNLVSWSAMVSCFANNNMGFESILTFIDMLENEHFPNEYCLSAAIRACSEAEYLSVGDIIFGFVIKSGFFESDVCVGCALIDMFAKGGVDLDSAHKVFEKMPEKNSVTWTLMITRFMQLGRPREAIELFLKMVLTGYEPDRFTLSSTISACAELQLLSLGKQFHSRAIKSGLANDRCVGCCLVDMYAKCISNNSMINARKVFDRISDNNVMTWTAIITGNVQSGGDEDAVNLFHRMILSDVQPNHFTFSSIFKAYANLTALREAEQAFTLAVKLGLTSVNCVGNSLISMYARSGKMEDAQKVFDIMFDKNLISYNTIIDAYAKNSNSEEAFELFHKIGDMGLGASAFTFASLLSGAASIGTISKGEQIHARLIKSGFESNQGVCNALISMYSKCGDILSAFCVFDEMGDQNVISWTSIITGFAKHGFGARALAIFQEMLRVGMRPNEITYTAVLSACSHVGLKSEGWKYFNLMSKDHGIVPKMEHYACMVDLLGRSGSLSEAIEFINSMPFAANALVWRTFLGACRVHGELELGKHAAEMIIKLEPNDLAAHVLLSNLYALRGEWEEVGKIRKELRERKLIKEAGCSWIEVENEVHKFYVGDTSHSNANEIYEKLEDLISKIKELGYKPNTDFVLHDVEEERKEQYLFQHSEKLAVVFGLISSSKPKPIRVFKNLRVCGDCHSAIKFMSAAIGREIVLRDSNRFHHIKNGRCSCNDYW